ncbi:MAG: YjjW family glycine radical enzyme activase [Marivita sp.]|uniref:YjjW family glycine radical enzyme activase n=1 Tax=Marivita sp. TaxID=2003365 RepID=UPI0025C5C32F|nr:YjjW family glycine radical enzyme activase [Marivita sp.]MCI5109769.1 YjjW family glycine radical enzyme activase [Marivita sp.]
MPDPIGTISRVLRWSVVDGPGNRLVLFLQGCNFNCPGCHNPHTIGVCNDCGDCIPACPTDALTLVDGRIAFDPTLCTDCDECLRACPISANPMVRRMSVEDVLVLLRRDVAFLNGLTVSGGEATMQLKFVRALFAAVKAAPDLAHLTCFVDSNGHLGPQGWAKLLDVTDGVMLDIKAFDPDRHRNLTGQGNERVLASARLLAKAGKLAELRFLLVPGQTDNTDEIDALRDFARSLGPGIRLRLNAFQHHGVRGPARDWPVMRRAGVEQAAARLMAADIGPLVLPSVWLNG